MGYSQAEVDRRILPPLDLERLQAEDLGRSKDEPFRFAIAVKVNFTLENSGSWQTLNEGSRIWRLRIHSMATKSLSLGISHFDLPRGATLWIYNPSHDQVQGPYTMLNRSPARRVFTPLIRGDEVVVEVDVPAHASQPIIEIGTVNQGYRGFN